MFRASCFALFACLLLPPSLLSAQTSSPVQVTLTPSANATASGVSLTATVQVTPSGGAAALPHPSGNVTFFDGTTALNPGGAALAANPGSTAATFAKVFGASDPALTANSSQPSGVVGDFNGDGRQDLALYTVTQPGTSSSAILLQVFLSTGSAGYSALPTQSLPIAALPASFHDVGALDVDGDGHRDLLLNNTVAYGKGDGTFGIPTVLPILATGFIQSYAVDMNGDGKLDIVAVNAPPDPNAATGPVQFTFTVFRNDGSGTFTSLGAFPLAAPLPSGTYAFFNIFGLSFADLNGDGKLDVLSQSNGVAFGNSASGNNFHVILNNGDGTFGAPRVVDNNTTFSLGYVATSFADLNGDGILDLVLAYSENVGGNYVGGALGNGDGTFGAINDVLLGSTLATGVGTPYVQCGDFNLDGKIDAVLGSGELALGNGDGTFSLATPLIPQVSNLNPLDRPASYPLLEATLTPSSFPSFVYLDLASGANAVFTPVDTSSVTTMLALSAGSHSLTAHYAGDTTYPAAVSPAVTLTVAPAATTSVIQSAINPAYPGENVAFTANVSGLAPGAGGTITFSNGSTPLGTVALTGGSASYTTSFTSAGDFTITASYSGDANNQASSANVTQAIQAPVQVGAVSGASTSLTVQSGSSVSAQVNVSGTGGFTGTVNLSCTGLPAMAACGFNPTSVMLSGSTPVAMASITVSTGTVGPGSARADDPLRAAAVLTCMLPLAGLLMLVPVCRGRRIFLSLAFLLFASVAGLTGCGGNSQPAQSSQVKTPPGSYTFQVVASSGSVTSTTNYTLTVQ